MARLATPDVGAVRLPLPPAIRKRGSGGPRARWGRERARELYVRVAMRGGAPRQGGWRERPRRRCYPLRLGAVPERRARGPWRWWPTIRERLPIRGSRLVNPARGGERSFVRSEMGSSGRFV